jgi:hypothetical protein
MVHRVALFVASLVAALTLAAGLFLAGFAPPGDPPAGPADPVAATAPAPSPRVQVDTVYVAPPVAPQDVTITKVARASRGGDDEGERGGDD